MLMLTGTIKSGKTRVLDSVLPGLLAARLAADPRSRRPVVFLHSFRLNAPVEESAISCARFPRRKLDAALMLSLATRGLGAGVMADALAGAAADSVLMEGGKVGRRAA
jgi:hypothetical protein